MSADFILKPRRAIASAFSSVSDSFNPLNDSAWQTIPPVLTRLYQARGVQSVTELALKLPHLLPAQDLKDIDKAVERLNIAINERQHIVIVGDFDADGATSTALMMLALRHMGANVDYVVPDRFKYGYGLTPEIVDFIIEHFAQHPADLLVTVDNGISSHAGVLQAYAAGLEVIITDHHLTTKTAPSACAVVNPNQIDCPFKSKALAGVGVAFYVLATLATKRRLAGLPTAKLSDYLDLVALGTVADVAPLDANNRILVAQGVSHIRQKRCRPGLLALLEIAGRNPEQLVAQDLGFVLGPRINAAGRMESMRIGIDCLIAPTFEEAYSLAQRLDELNRERREVETKMKAAALAALERVVIDEPLDKSTAYQNAIVLYEPDWHQGVIGIVAGRLKEQFYRPSVVFAASDESKTTLKGSARSIEGVHIRDAIERVAEQNPGLITHFGGHAAAAGLTLPCQHLSAFKDALNQIMQEHEPAIFQPVTLTDGALQPQEFTLEVAQLLQTGGPWGQGFAAPLFEGEFDVLSKQWLKEKHLKLQLAHPLGTGKLDAIWFNAQLQNSTPDFKRVHLAYRLDINHFRGESVLQLMIEYFKVLG